MTPTRRAGSYWVPVAMVVLGLVVGGATALLAGTNDEPVITVASRSEPPDEATISRVSSSAVLVNATGCNLESIGTGVVVESGVITNAHVVSGSSEVVVIDEDGDPHAAEVRSFDPELDLALLVSPGLQAAPLPTGSPIGGTDAVALIRGLDEVVAQSVTIVRTINIRSGDIYGDGRYERRGMELTADIGPGDSGGAVVDARGDVVGIVFSASRRNNDVAYAISAAEIAGLVSSASDEPVATGDCHR